MYLYSSRITFASNKERNKKVIPTTLEKYSRGRRGAPAKGVGRVTGARVQIPPSPFLLFQTHFGDRKKI